MKIYKPNQEKLKKFLIPPIIFAVVACAIIILALGLHIGAILGCLMIIAVVCLPFIVFIAPTFLFEKIIIEDFTSSFFFVFLFFTFKQVIHIADIISIEEHYRNDKKGDPKEIRIITPQKTITLSEVKYTPHTIKAMIKDYKEKNKKITVTLLT